MKSSERRIGRGGYFYKKFRAPRPPRDTIGEAADVKEPELKVRPCPVVFASFSGEPKACMYKIIEGKCEEHVNMGQCRGMIDKYIVNSLGVVALVLLWSSTGVILVPLTNPNLFLANKAIRMETVN